VTTLVAIAMVLMPTNAHHAQIIIILMRAILLMRVGVWNVTNPVAIAMVLRPTNAHHAQTIIILIWAILFMTANV